MGERYIFRDVEIETERGGGGGGRMCKSMKDRER